MKILIVDDSVTIRAALRSLLEKMGHTVAEANDGAQALAAYRSDKPELVLIDVVMPVMDGYEAARRMRESSPEEWVPDGPLRAGCKRVGTHLAFLLWIPLLRMALSASAWLALRHLRRASRAALIRQLNGEDRRKPASSVNAHQMSTTLYSPSR